MFCSLNVLILKILYIAVNLILLHSYSVNIAYLVSFIVTSKINDLRTNRGIISLQVCFHYLHQWIQPLVPSLVDFVKWAEWHRVIRAGFTVDKRCL